MSTRRPVKSRATNQIALLPEPALPPLSRPLSLAGGHTYAAIWPYVDRTQASHLGPGPAITRQLVLIRDDGDLILAPGAATARAPAAEFFLPRRPPLPADRLWSAAGVQRYLAGHRPAPAVVFGRLVSVLNQFIDFTGSLGAPALMAEFFATFILSTWLAPAFPFLGLLWLTGDNGSGKSRLLSLLSRLSHLGLYLPVPPPPAALRSLASLGAALSIDDADFLSLGSDDGHFTLTDRAALLLAGRQRGALLPVTLLGADDAAGAPRTRQLDVSGPRLFASVRLPHPAIARYFLVVPLVRTPLASLAFVDPADPSAWPAGLSLTGLVDDLWALALSRLPELAPHLAQAAKAASLAPSHLASSPTVSSAPTPTLPLIGSALQPWHALLTTASWLSASGVPDLLPRMLSLARAYHVRPPASQSADLTTLVLHAVFECASAVYRAKIEEVTAAQGAEYNRAGGTVDDDEVEAIPAFTAEHNRLGDKNDRNDSFQEIHLRNMQRRIARADWANAHPTPISDIQPVPFPPVVAFTITMLLDTLARLAPNVAPDLVVETLKPVVVNGLLRQLNFRPLRTKNMRLWTIPTTNLARLAQAYSIAIPTDLAPHLPFVAPLEQFPK